MSARRWLIASVSVLFVGACSAPAAEAPAGAPEKAPAAEPRGGDCIDSALGAIELVDLADGGTTQIHDINRFGDIAGSVVAHGVGLGFIRRSDGELIWVDVEGPAERYRTTIVALNDVGDAAGTSGSGEEAIGFLRRSDGSIETFVVGESPRTGIRDMNDAGGIVGSSSEGGYVRLPDGSVSVFDDLPSIAGGGRIVPANLVRVSSISGGGLVAGHYGGALDAENRSLVQSFIRHADGRTTTFTIPESTTTSIWAVNDAGMVAGTHHSTVSPVRRAFIRDASGQITDLDLPRSTATYIHDMNERGDVAGTFRRDEVTQAFVRFATGRVVTFMPDERFRWIWVDGMNDSGDVVGYVDVNGGGRLGFVARYGTTCSPR